MRGISLGRVEAERNGVSAVAAAQLTLFGRSRSGQWAARLLIAYTSFVALDFGGAQAWAADDAPAPTIATGLPNNGDPWGMRAALKERGLEYSFVLTSEILSNVDGGRRRGTVFEGKLETIVQADLQKMAGLSGLSFFTNIFQIHNTGGISRDYVGGFNTISNIEALPTLRLSEIWLEQKLHGDALTLRAGQLAADTEFFISSLSTFFMNSDWPAITKQDLPSGGPAYPLSTPGIRLKAQPTKDTTVLVALFNGDPAGPGKEDPEIKNHYGLNFRMVDPPFLISEVQRKYNVDKSAGLDGTLRLGAWYHFGSFDSPRFDTTGLSLANPASNGIAARLRGDYGIYGIVDQMIYRPKGGGPDDGVGVFSRISGSPNDRNLVDFYLDGGVVATGLVPGRPKDKFGATFIYSRIGDATRDLQKDQNFYHGTNQPIPDFELNLAVAYQAEIIPGWTVQPEVHHVVHIGGRVPDAQGRETADLRDATVFAVRSVINY